eukprot:9066172-Pyramimonas_sp.AAC.2
MRQQGLELAPQMRVGTPHNPFTKQATPRPQVREAARKGSGKGGTPSPLRVPQRVCVRGVVVRWRRRRWPSAPRSTQRVEAKGAHVVRLDELERHLLEGRGGGRARIERCRAHVVAAHKRLLRLHREHLRKAATRA